jgi:DNA-binding response OmpR family regulator
VTAPQTQNYWQNLFKGGSPEHMKIVVADIDPKTLEAVGTCCSIRWPHRELLSTEDPDELLRWIEEEAPDLVVLATNFSEGAGLAICRQIRAFSAVPLIMTDSTGEEGNLIRALDAGADDCLSKPIRPLELLARIVALLRRCQKLPLVSHGQPFVAGELYIDFDTYEVRIDGREVKLTFTEFEILRCLVHNSRRIMSHSQLASLVWGEDAQGSRNALKVHVQHLRNKLGDTAKQSRYILSERGLGYKFAVSAK